MMIELVRRHQQEIAGLCRKYGVRRLDLFGSAATGDGFDEVTSDVDFLYDLNGKVEDLFDRYFGFKEELEALLGRPVDLISIKDVSNPFFLEVANRHRVELYAA